LTTPLSIGTVCQAFPKYLSKGLTQPQVDALLAGMWANKDATKPRANTERAIYCTSGCAAPSAAGYTTKANLQAYATPRQQLPTYSRWTVSTN